GIFKRGGTATWKLAFLFVVSLIARCSSCVQMINLYSKDSLLQAIFRQDSISQSAFSRFLVSRFDWAGFNLKRVQRFQEDADTRLVDGDVIALDDTF
ncbi:hypothetical protein MO973_00295, partial [Paenibacillus sp. TRM 82003]|nr:hypothetical protein [Paenibacillus sp. TRM 82003]